MHTFGKSSDGTFVVGHYVAADDGRGATFEVQFKGLTFYSAISLVSYLNGGNVNAGDAFKSSTDIGEYLT